MVAWNLLHHYVIKKQPELSGFSSLGGKNCGIEFKVSANHTSQECADCGHIHPDNRKSQALFQCRQCGHTDNADRNASLIIKKRAIDLMLDTGSVLSERGVLSLSGTGRGAKSQPMRSKLLIASGLEALKKKGVRLPAKAA